MEGAGCMGHALGVCGAAIVPLCRAQPNEPISVTQRGLWYDRR